MPVILVVEDHPELLALYKDALFRHTMYGAASVKEARDLFTKHRSSIDIIILDGNVAGEEPTTERFAKDVRESGFTGPMIAASSDPSLSEQLFRCGCSHRVVKGDTRNLLKVIEQTV